MNRVLLLLGLLLGTTACLGSPAKLPACDAWETEGAICGRMNPEDLAFLPDAEWILISEMAFVDPRADRGLPPTRPGRLSALRPGDREVRRVFPTEWTTSARHRPGWGADSCTTPPDPDLFQPHGIDVGTGPDDLPMVAVVNHGGREAVELFEIVSPSEPALEWRGCVVMPVDSMTNDVALIEGGGFFVTRMLPAIESTGFRAFWTLMKVQFGATTGDVLRWTPGQGVREVANSRGSGPNGIAARADGREVFVSEWGGKKIYRLRLGADTEQPPSRVETALDHRPDNLTWTADGQLLVAGQKAGPTRSLACGSIRTGGCDIGYSVYRIDPESLAATRIEEGRGAASVALEVGRELYIGVFAGDQISRVPRSD